jgi:hypothetical protein
MEQYILELLKASPGLAVGVALVVLFLKSMEKRDVAIKDLHLEHLEERKRGVAVLEKCTEALGACNETNCRVAEVVDRSNKLLDEIYNGDGRTRT